MIRLDSVKIERFRGIRSGEVSGFADVNLMIGRNNCGKSTVAEAITLATVGSAGNPQQPIVALHENKCGPFVRNAYDAWAIQRHETQRSAEEFWFQSDQTSPYRCETTIVDDRGEQVLRSGVVFESSAKMERIHDSLDRSNNSGPARFARDANVFLPADARCTDIEKAAWPRLLTARKDKAIVTAINEVFGMDVEQLSLPPDGRMMLLLPQQGLPLDVYGDGTRAALRSLIVLASMQGTLYIMEEPECHQHPGSLERFAKVICKLAKSQSVQLLITTHSVECVKAFLEAAAEGDSESAVFHLRLEEGELTSRRLDAETVESLQSTGVDVRTLDLYV
jgi:predicted ATPase